MIYGMSHRSIPQRVTTMAAQTVILAVSLWLLLFGGLETVSGWFKVSWSAASELRRTVLALCIIVLYLRFAGTIIVLLKRAMGWEEAVSIPFAFMLYYIGFALLAGPVTTSFGAVEYIGILLFAAGSTINTLSEVLRNRWKKDPANQGKLYTGGLFRYSMHVNYFGDLVWATGLALITANPWSATIPVMLFGFFAFYNAPLLDRHLAEKYGDEFEAYRKRTKRLIPYIF